MLSQAEVEVINLVNLEVSSLEVKKLNNYNLLRLENLLRRETHK